MHISWTFTWQPEAVDHYVSNRQSASDATTVPQAFFDRLTAMGCLAEPFRSVLVPAIARRTAKYSWLMRTVQIPKSDLIKSADARTVLLGDAAHAMPIVAGEGGNHALLHGVLLGHALALSSTTESCIEKIAKFYKDQSHRWEDGVRTSQQEFTNLHKPKDHW